MAHTVLDVAVAGACWYIPAEHNAMGAHRRSVVAVGAVCSNCRDEQIVVALHVISASTVHGAAWNWPAGHCCVQAVHTLAVVLVHAVVWYVLPATQTGQPVQTVSVVLVQLYTRGNASGHAVHGAHCRGEVRVMGTVTNCPAGQNASFEHTTSDVTVAGVLTNHEPLHTETGVHASVPPSEYDSPSTHGRHTRSLIGVSCSLAPDPASHTVAVVHETLSVKFENDSGGHAWHVRSVVAVPSARINVPGSHVVKAAQAAAPSSSEKVFGGHAAHTGSSARVSFWVVYVPASQRFVGGHGPDWPASGCVWPSSHGTHSVPGSLSRSVDPGAHGVPVHDVLPPGTYWPAGQS